MTSVPLFEGKDTRVTPSGKDQIAGRWERLINGLESDLQGRSPARIAYAAGAGSSSTGNAVKKKEQDNDPSGQVAVPGKLPEKGTVI